MLAEDERVEVEEDVHEGDDRREHDRVADRPVGVVGRESDEALASVAQPLRETDGEEEAGLLGVVRGERAQRPAERRGERRPAR